jgi:hypothetical protein
MASDQTEARRERMRSLWINPDRKIAEILIEEGYAGQVHHTADAKRKQLAAMQRNVWNDRQWWKKKWRAEKNATNEDASETRGEYLAVLDSYKEVGVDILGDPKVKGTPRVQALVALTKIEEAKAKARGVAETTPVPPGDDGPTAPFLGVVVGLKNLSPNVIKRIKKWGKGEDDAGDGE